MRHHQVTVIGWLGFDSRRLHAGGPEALFAGSDNVIEGIFAKLATLRSELLADVG